MKLKLRHGLVHELVSVMQGINLHMPLTDADRAIIRRVYDKVHPQYTRWQAIQAHHNQVLLDADKAGEE